MIGDAHREEPVPGHLEKKDVIFLVGLFAAFAALAVTLVFVRGQQAAAVGVIWSWLVELSIWIYLIVSAI